MKPLVGCSWDCHRKLRSYIPFGSISGTPSCHLKHDWYCNWILWAKELRRANKPQTLYQLLLMSTYRANLTYLSPRKDRMCGRARKGLARSKSNFDSGPSPTEGPNLVVWARLGLLQERCDCLACTSISNVSGLWSDVYKRNRAKRGHFWTPA